MANFPFTNVRGIAKCKLIAGSMSENVAEFLKKNGMTAQEHYNLAVREEMETIPDPVFQAYRDGKLFYALMTPSGDVIALNPHRWIHIHNTVFDFRTRKASKVSSNLTVQWSTFSSLSGWVRQERAETIVTQRIESGAFSVNDLRGRFQRVPGRTAAETRALFRKGESIGEASGPRFSCEIVPAADKNSPAIVCPMHEVEIHQQKKNAAESAGAEPQKNAPAEPQASPVESAKTEQEQNALAALVQLGVEILQSAAKAYEQRHADLSVTAEKAQVAEVQTQTPTSVQTHTPVKRGQGVKRARPSTDDWVPPASIARVASTQREPRARRSQTPEGKKAAMRAWRNEICANWAAMYTRKHKGTAWGEFGAQPAE